MDTYKLSVFVGHGDVHLGALGADDLALQRVLAQEHLAAVCLVDGDGGDRPRHLRAQSDTLPSDMLLRLSAWKHAWRHPSHTHTHTYLDLHILAVDDLYSSHHVVKHQAHLLTVVWETGTCTVRGRAPQSLD